MTSEVRPCIMPRDALLDHLFRGRVDTGGGFIQYQDLRVKGNGPGKGDQLLFSDRKIAATFTNLFQDIPSAVAR